MTFERDITTPNLYGLADIICNYQKVTHSLFVRGQQKAVDADYVLSLLKPKFSEDGSSRRVEEEQMMDYFQDFLMGLEDEKVGGDLEALALAYATGDDNDETVKPIHNVDENGDESESESFSIHAGYIIGGCFGMAIRCEALGIGSCNLSVNVPFDHDCKNRNPHHTICFPVVGACGRDISLPVSHSESDSSYGDDSL